ncbi:IclR family transcriptional regulator [Sphingobium estronivorans]|uniref:IclR family transcriptional regulator n=1 Tax=Sphingobium estronivorans TaxID=1577690 RepID=UPI00123B7D73|nr:IclR family transcriptional regulator [Sphingobium estronivorans]
MADMRDKVQAAITTAEILKALGRTGAFAPLSQVAKVAGMAPAKVHRYVHALIEAGLAAQDPATGHYGLGAEMIAMGAAALGRVDLVKVSAEPMEALRERIGSTCLLSVWANRGPTAVRVLQSISAITVVTRLGSVLPLRSATGLIFAAFLSSEQLQFAEDYEQFRMGALDRQPVGELLSEIRERRMTNVNGLLVPGIDALAAPIFDVEGRCAAVLCTLGPATAFDARLDGDTAIALRACAERISFLLGHDGDVRNI